MLSRDYLAADDVGRVGSVRHVSRVRSVESVESVDIRFEEKLVVLSLKQGTEIKDDEVKQVVEWAGYEVAAITREDTPQENTANE